MSPKTAVLLIDPLNEFLHPDGKLYARLKESLEATDTIKNMHAVIKTARSAKIPIFYCQHQLIEDGQLANWNHKSKSHLTIQKIGSFRVGSFGAQIYQEMEPDRSNGDVVVSRHWNSSSFANTDLDFQLRQQDITHVICVGMVANTCLESTARYAVELGYHVTILSDATAGFSVQLKDVAEKIIWPTIVDQVISVDEWAASLAQ
ncbi:putative isochorismatase family YddQ-like protein [Cladobotryum mycophilum]|uniref:Isochorismatase family YddQ-like protein n=1 Tax=Cladobotryum mycophilum TaxID=491253 RepID=A0ABR0S9Q3_9HYPO